jgi:hypothetical protein
VLYSQAEPCTTPWEGRPTAPCVEAHAKRLVADAISPCWTRDSRRVVLAFHAPMMTSQGPRAMIGRAHHARMNVRRDAV